jgi:hypothetical protein
MGIEDGGGKFVSEVAAVMDGEWLADWEAAWAGEEVSQPLQKIRPVAIAAAATDSMEREDGEFIPSPTNPIP